MLRMSRTYRRNAGALRYNVLSGGPILADAGAFRPRGIELITVGAVACLLAASSMGGCAPAGGNIDPGLVGVTAGGTSDNAEARAEIEAGYIPDPDKITVEGFLSEHDIPITPPEDAGEFYASFAVAWRQPFGEPAPMGDLFVGLGTNIDLDSFDRGPQNIAVVVDRSLSMEYSASATDHRPKMDAVKEALNRLVDQLGEEDILTLISFHSEVFIDVPSTFVRDTRAIRDAINRLKPEGNTDLYAALLRGFEKAEEQVTKGRGNRVILLTDAQPTVGSTLPSDIAKLVRDYAKRGIGFTLLGVGADFDTELAHEVADVRDANYYFLADSERIRTVFDDFRFMVTPAAHDLSLEVQVADGVGIRDVYGVPDYTPGQRGARIEIPTLFFSRREGGGTIVVQLTSAAAPTFEEAITAGHATLAYTLPDGTRRTSETPLTLPAGLSATGEPPWFSEDSARRAALLLDTVLVLKDATRAAYYGNERDATAMLQDFLDYFDMASLGMSDRTDPSSRGLKDEREMLEALLGSVRDGYASPYYGYYPY